MEEQLEQSKRRLHFCMALIGGWFGAYAILRFHHFASAVTVNFIEVFTSAVQENWIKALLRMGIVILYVFTIFLAACLSKRCKGDLRMWAILSDAAAACMLSVLLRRNAVGIPCRRYCRMCAVGDGVGKLHDPACSATCGSGFCVAAPGFPDAGKDRRSL